MSKKAKKRMRQLLAVSMTATMALQALPIAQVGAVYEEELAQQEALRTELASAVELYPEGAFAFYETGSEISESDGERAVKIVRWGDTSAAATVDIKAVDATAKYGVDYEFYYVDGLNRTEPELEKAQPETTISLGEEDFSELPDSFSTLRSFYAGQSGTQPVATNWRGEYEEYVTRVATERTQAEVINTIEGASLTLSFAPGEYEKTIYVKPLNDDLSESDEIVALILGNVSSGTTTDQMSHTVKILDDEPVEEITFAMAQSVVVVPEDAEFAEIKVKRTTGLNYLAGATFSTAAGSAQPDVHYTPVDGDHVQFAAGETEQTIRIPVKNFEPGLHFTVKLDTNAVNVEEGKDTVTVWLGEMPGSLYDASKVNEFGFPILESRAEAKPYVEISDGQGTHYEDAEYSSTEWLAAVTENGVTYDTVTTSGFWRVNYRSDGKKKNFAINTAYAAKIRVKGSTNGKWALSKGKDYSIAFGRGSWHDYHTGDETKNYDYTYDLSWGEAWDNRLYLYGYPTGCNHYCYHQVTEYTTYYPRYTFKLKDANPQFEGKLITGCDAKGNPSSSETYKVNALTKQSWTTATQSYGGKNVSFNPGTLQNGIAVDHYEFYIGGKKVGQTTSSSYSYAEIDRNIRQYNESSLKSNKYTIEVKPIYRTLDTTLNLKTTNANVLVYDNYKSNTVKCTQLDKVKVTVKSPEKTVSVDGKESKLKDGQEFKASYIKASSSLGSIVRNNKNNDVEFTQTFEMNADKENIETDYKEPKLSIGYHPNEVTADNADGGTVAISTFNQPDKFIGEATVLYDVKKKTNVAYPFKMGEYYYVPVDPNPKDLAPTDAAYKPFSQSTWGVSQKFIPYDVKEMGTTYMAQVVKSDKNQDRTDEKTGRKYQTKTLWTFRDKYDQGRTRTYYGDAFVFDPFYADTEITYHFKEMQADVKQVGMTGQVTTVEQVLFSKNTKKTTKPAVGVKVNVGGQNVTTGSDGTFTVGAYFNKGENVGAYASYDTIRRAFNVDMSDNKVKNLQLDVNSEDGILIDCNQTVLTVSNPVYDSTGNAVRSGENNEILYKKESAINVTKEDRYYQLTVVAEGKSASIVPKVAEFRLYDKHGKLKTAYKKQIAFEKITGTSKYKAVLETNPAKDGIDVGDSFTVKCYDTNGQGYYEHQTAITVAEKLNGMYTFNFNNVVDTSDNVILKALGGIALGYDTVLDALSNDYGIYEVNLGKDETGNDITEQHDMFGLGASFKFSGSTGGDKKDGGDSKTDKKSAPHINDAFSPVALAENDKKDGGDSGKKDGGDKDKKDGGISSGNMRFMTAEDLYNQKKKLDEDFANLRSGTFEPQIPAQSDTIGLFGGDGGAFDIQLSTCVIMDCVLDNVNEDHKGEYMFSDFYVVGNMAANFSNSWPVPVGPVEFAFSLSITTGDAASGNSPGVRWHFYNADEATPYYISSGGIIDMFATQELENEGELAFKINVKGSAAATVGGGLAGVRGSLEVGYSHSSYYGSELGKTSDSSWKHYGVIRLTPKVELKVLIAWVKLWSDTWQWTYGDASAASQVNAKMQEAAEEGILFSPTTIRRLNYLADAPATASLTVNETDQLISDIIAEDSNVRMQDLGNGKYMAVYLDNVAGRAASDALGAYYTVFDGTAWSAPALLEDDGTVDQLPTICEAGSKGWLVAWSDASRKLSETEDLTAQLNTLNLTGRFYNAETGEFGEVMELTRETAEDTLVADTNPQIVYYNEGNKEYMKLYYTKSEYEVSNEAEGEVIGDILNPYEIIAVRNYDFENDTWREDYVGNAKQVVINYVGADKYDDYVKNWYGQEVLSLAPTVELEETLDENGYWAKGTTAKVGTKDLSQSTIKGGDTIAYNHLSLHAYALDKGGMAQQTGDQNLYLQIYNFHEDTYHHPIQITSNDAEITDIQFVRMPAVNIGGDQKENVEYTYLYWLEDGAVKRINISDLVSNHLLKGETADGKAFYYIDKSLSETPYEPAETVASAYTVKDDVKVPSISNFRAYQNGVYNYTVWTQFVTKGEGENAKMELQLFATRTNTETSEHTDAVQLTDTEGLYIQDFDCVVTKDGALDVAAECQALDANGDPNSATSVLKYFHIKPAEDVRIESGEQAASAFDDDGKPTAVIAVTAANRGLKTAEDVVIEMQDAEGKVVSTTAAPTVSYETVESKSEDGGVVITENKIETPAPKQNVVGGNTYEVNLPLPAAEDGTYSGTVVARIGGNVVASKKIEGTIASTFEISDLETEITERDHVHFKGFVQNTTVVGSKEDQLEYGYLNKDNERVAIGTVPVAALDAGGTTSFDFDADIKFSDFEETTAEDGSIINSKKFYLAVKSDAEHTVYSDVELEASGAEVELMKNLGKAQLSAKAAVYNENGGLDEDKSIAVGKKAYLSLTVGDEFAQNLPDYVNRTRVIWTESSDAVASVDPDGVVTALGEGTTTLKGYVLPANSTSILYENGYSEEVDNYATVPASLIVPIEATIKVGAATTEPEEPTSEPTTEPTDAKEADTNYIAPINDICEMAGKDYSVKNDTEPARTEAVKNEDGTLSITMYDDQNNKLNVYTIDPTTGKGTDQDGKAVNLPKTGVTSKNTAAAAASALAFVLAGAFAVVKSGIFRRKRDDE